MQHHAQHHPEISVTEFPTDPTGLPDAGRPALLDLADGDVLALRIVPVAKRLGDARVRMLGYNGSIPGPTLKVREGSEIVVNVTNHGDLETTVHWHGLRLENKFDGVPHETQKPIPVGGSFTYRIQFPDPGLYWYHPHVREDYTQELGLYGNILVTPSDPDYWLSVDREFVLTLDDILLEDGMIAPFSPDQTTFAAMGRFGNQMLVSGEPEMALTATSGEVVRLWLTNTASARVFNLRLAGAQMKLVGGDSGRVEHPELVSEVLIAPSERAVVDVLFPESGEFVLEHQTPDRVYRLASFTVNGKPAAASVREAFRTLRDAPELVAERERIQPWLSAQPDKVLALVAEMEDLALPAAGDGPLAYACPMHPEVVREEPGKCPKCGMKLMATALSAEPSVYTCPMHPEVTDTQPGRCPECGMKLLPAETIAKAGGAEHHHGHDQAETHGEATSESGHGGHAAPEGIEWEDDMLEVNRMTTPANMHWKFVDRTPGVDSGPIDWQFKVGDQVKIRLVNEMESDHPMHHPFHLHGAGRFLVIARDGVTEPNLVWKDTVLVRTGQTVDILFDVTNPGLWMAHCHIAEHMQSGMMFSFAVARN